jgi:hypothetical protein
MCLITDGEEECNSPLGLQGINEGTTAENWRVTPKLAMYLIRVSPSLRLNAPEERMGV